MNYYEIVYIIHPALQAGHLDDIISQVNKKIENLNGKILYQDNWGKKKLSYLIQKQKYGTYILLQCMIDGLNINEISTDFELNTNILRHLVSKINEDELLEEKKSGDTTENKKNDLGTNNVSEKEKNEIKSKKTNDDKAVLIDEEKNKESGE